MENLPTQKGIFANEEAYNRYELFKSRVVLVERRFPTFYLTFLESFLNAINDLGWEMFCHKREQAIVPIVKEFYAHIDQVEGYTTLVRGKIVDWSPKAINQLFHLQSFEYATFNEMVLAPSDDQLEMALKMVAIEGTRWQLSRGGARR